MEYADRRLCFLHVGLPTVNSRGSWQRSGITRWPFMDHWWFFKLYGCIRLMFYTSLVRLYKVNDQVNNSVHLLLTGLLQQYMYCYQLNDVTTARPIYAAFTDCLYCNPILPSCVETYPRLCFLRLQELCIPQASRCQEYQTQIEQWKKTWMGVFF